MGEKALIVFMVLFILAGVFAYEHYLNGKGEIGPVARIVDFVHLADFSGKNDSKATTRRTTYRFNVRDGLEQLKERYSEIETARERLISNQQAIVSQILAMNDEVQADAGHYAELLRKESEDFVSRFLTPAPAAPPEGGAAGPAQLSGPLKDNLVLRPEVINKDEWLGDIDNLIKQAGPGIVAEYQEVCPEGSIKTCLKERPEEVARVVTSAINETMLQPQAELADLQWEAERFSRECGAFSANLQATEEQLAQAGERMEGKLQALSSQLVAVTEQDLADLRQLCDAFFKEGQMLSENVLLNIGRLRNGQELASGRMSAIISRLQGHGDRFAGLADKGPDTLSGQARLLDNLTAMNGQLKDMTAGYEKKWTEALGRPGGQGEAPASAATSLLQRFRTRIKAGSNAESRPATSRQTVRDRLPGTRDVNTTGPALPASPDADEVKRGVQRLRDQARDQGFYDPK